MKKHIFNLGILPLLLFFPNVSNADVLSYSTTTTSTMNLIDITSSELPEATHYIVTLYIPSGGGAQRVSARFNNDSTGVYGSGTSANYASAGLTDNHTAFIIGSIDSARAGIVRYSVSNVPGSAKYGDFTRTLYDSNDYGNYDSIEHGTFTYKNTASDIESLQFLYGTGSNLFPVGTKVHVVAINDTEAGVGGGGVASEYIIDVGSTVMLGGILAFLIAYWMVGLIRFKRNK